MSVHVSRLERDNLLHEYGVDTQRLMPWAVLNAPFEASYAVVRAGTDSTLHSHHEHEIFIALRGSATVECGGKTATFRAGEVSFFRPGLLHRVLNADNSEDFEFYSVWWDDAMAETFLARHREPAEIPAAADTTAEGAQA